MVLDKQSQALLKEMREQNLPPVNTVSPKESRQQFDLRPRLPGPKLPKVKYISVPMNGFNINCRIYVTLVDYFMFSDFLINISNNLLSYCSLARRML